VQQAFIDRFRRDPRRFQLLFLSQGFSNGPSLPLGSHGSCSLGARTEAEQGPRAEAEAETKYFYCIAGGRKCWESFEGRHGSWKFENHCSKWYWRALVADPATRGEQPCNSPLKFSKTCSVVSSVEYISWLQPCLLSKIKL